MKKIELGTILFFLSLSSVIFTGAQKIETKDGVRIIHYQNRIEKYDPGGGISVQTPHMNTVSYGIDLDSNGRIWVLTLNRQLEPEEQTRTISGGGGTQTLQKGKIKTMDIYKLEIFDNEGVFLGRIPLDHLAHRMRILKDFIFIADMENVRYYQYEIIEK